MASQLSPGTAGSNFESKAAGSLVGVERENREGGFDGGDGCEHARSHKYFNQGEAERSSRIEVFHFRASEYYIVTCTWLYHAEGCPGEPSCCRRRRSCLFSLVASLP
jgi:hypothetical protein